MPSPTPLFAQFRLQVAMACTTIALFCAMLPANDWLFHRLEFAPGIHYVYLPAGMRLLCVLLFAEAGAIGLLLVCWGFGFLVQFPGQFERPFVGGILAAAVPYLVYRLARDRWGLGASLANLTPRRLLWLVLAYSAASPLLHHAYFALAGHQKLLGGLFAMFVGDLLGSLIVIYGLKALLALLPRPLTRTGV